LGAGVNRWPKYVERAVDENGGAYAVFDIPLR
jgi:hypothetical protein